MSSFKIIDFDGDEDTMEKPLKMLNDLSSRAKVIRWEVITFATSSATYEELSGETERIIVHHYGILVEYEKSVSTTD